MPDPQPSVQLNPEQAAVVASPAPRLRVLAGAGSGKTLALTQRVLRALRGGARPEGIVLCTFTQRAATELSARLGPAGRGVRVGTLHALARRETAPHLGLLGYRRRPRLWAEGAQLRALGEAAQQADMALAPEALQRLRARAIAGDLRPEELAPSLGLPAAPAAAAIAGYEALKAARDAMDFEDLLLAWRDLLAPGSPARGALLGGVRQLLVDEYQDLSPLQIDITEALAAGGAQLCVVGDPAQSIYGFRGVRPDNLQRFAQRAPTETIRLSTSYRCSPQILDFSRTALRDPPPALFTQAPAGPPPHLHVAADPSAEAAWVIDQVHALVAAGVPAHAQAVLYRSHRLAQALSAQLQRRGLPHQTRGGRAFLQTPQARAALALLDALGPTPGPEACLQLLRQLPQLKAGQLDALRPQLAAGGLRGLHPPPAASPGLVEALGELRALAEALPPAPTLAQLLPPALGSPARPGWLARLLLSRHPDAPARIHSLAQLAEAAARAPEDPPTLLPLPEGDPAGLNLSTVHQAKGLQWRVVFLIGLAEGATPSAAAARTPEGEAEERRIFYVACTRARERLLLSYPAQRGGRPALPSRFLAGLDPHDPPS